MTPAVTIIGMAGAFLFGGGTGLLYWRSIARKTNAEGTDTIAAAAAKLVESMQSVVGSLEARLANNEDRTQALEEDHEQCTSNLSLLAAEVRRLGGNPALIVVERRRTHRAARPPQERP